MRRQIAKGSDLPYLVWALLMRFVSRWTMLWRGEDSCALTRGPGRARLCSPVARGGTPNRTPTVWEGFDLSVPSDSGPTPAESVGNRSSNPSLTVGARLGTRWGSAGDAYWGSVGDAYRGSVGDAYRGSAGDAYWGSAGDAYWGSAGDAYWGLAGDAIRRSVGARFKKE
ncbi:MAG: hypothetical protein CHACPFDD_03326 [Phycisphaerae bacterium]|nr:hypothetical protein [Phycisphaerae bacterium]